MQQNNDVNMLLDMLESELRRAGTMPLTGKQLIDASTCLDILENIKYSLPDSIKRASNILAESESMLREGRERAERVLMEAQARAEDIVADANREADRLGGEHEIAQRARMQANEIVMSATQHADAMVARAESHCNQVYDATVNYVDETMTGMHDSLVQHMRLLGDEIETIRDSRERLLGNAPESFHNSLGNMQGEE